MPRRLHILALALSFVGFCVSSAELSLATFKGYSDDGMIFDPFQRDANSHYSIWLYLTVAFVVFTIILAWSLIKFNQKR